MELIVWPRYCVVQLLVWDIQGVQQVVSNIVGRYSNQSEADEARDALEHTSQSPTAEYVVVEILRV